MSPGFAQDTAIPQPGDQRTTAAEPAPQRVVKDHVEVPHGPENEVVQAEMNPNAPPPSAASNATPSQLDWRVIAVYSLLWVFAMVLAMSALLRAEATDEYHQPGPTAR